MNALLFDLDGTLLNTLEDIAIACNHALKKFGYPAHDVSSYRQMVGNGFEMLVKRAIGTNFSTNPEQLVAMVKLAKEYYAQNMFSKTLPYSEIPETLKKLQDQNLLLGVFSNKPDELSQLLIAHFFPDISFFTVTGARPRYPLKPDPLVLIDLLTQAKIPLSSAIYVGDSDVDVLTAKNAAIPSIGVAWGFRGREELINTGADYVIKEPSEIFEIIKSREN